MVWKMSCMCKTFEPNPKLDRRGCVRNPTAYADSKHSSKIWNRLLRSRNWRSKRLLDPFALQSQHERWDRKTRRRPRTDDEDTLFQHPRARGQRGYLGAPQRYNPIGYH